MAEVVRVANYNVANLFTRWRFNNLVAPELGETVDHLQRQGFVYKISAKQRELINDLIEAKTSEAGGELEPRDRQRLENAAYREVLGPEEKRLTGKQIRELDADILCLQEVENLPTLKAFRSEYLPRGRYVHALVIDGNDPRGIDVAILSRWPIVHIRSHQALEGPSELDDANSDPERIFARDCLEATVEGPAGKRLTLFVNHFKSMIRTRFETRSARMRQARAVRAIAAAHDGCWLVCGDLNDHRDETTERVPLFDANGRPRRGPDNKVLREERTTGCGILDLLDWDEVTDVLDWLPDQTERWTHDYRSQRHQLDYMLLNSELAAASHGALPEVPRTGIVADDEGKRASDHCPIAIDLTLP